MFNPFAQVFIVTLALKVLIYALWTAVLRAV